jgi:lysozyme family protein
MSRAKIYIPRILKHEGGFVDHPRDPGGATNRGVTIGTLKRLGIDVDGDGDSDITDLRNLRESDAVRVFKLFYADKVQADLLPPGLDYAMTDFAVNSGPSRAVKHLQRILGVEQDGDMGPKTMAKVWDASATALIVALSESRMRFLRGLDTWDDFGRGWTARVEGVQRAATADASAQTPVAPLSPNPVADSRPADPVTKSPWAALIAALLSLFRKGT